MRITDTIHYVDIPEEGRAERCVLHLDYDSQNQGEVSLSYIRYDRDNNPLMSVDFVIPAGPMLEFLNHVVR